MDSNPIRRREPDGVGSGKSPGNVTSLVSTGGSKAMGRRRESDHASVHGTDIRAYRDGAGAGSGAEMDDISGGV